MTTTNAAERLPLDRKRLTEIDLWCDRGIAMIDGPLPGPTYFEIKALVMAALASAPPADQQAIAEIRRLLGHHISRFPVHSRDDHDESRCDLCHAYRLLANLPPADQPAPQDGAEQCKCRVIGNHEVDAAGCPLHSRRARAANKTHSSVSESIGGAPTGEGGGAHTPSVAQGDRPLVPECAGSIPAVSAVKPPQPEPAERVTGEGLPRCAACSKPILHSVDLCQIDGYEHGIIELDQHCWRMFGEPLTYAKLRRSLDRYREIQPAQPDAALRVNCNGSCDIALARRQVGPDGIVPGNARECAELWEREAARLYVALSESKAECDGAEVIIDELRQSIATLKAELERVKAPVPLADEGASCGRCIRCLDDGWDRPENAARLVDIRPSRRIMVVCEYCGNKRCPHATDCRNVCTRSNEPGQAGSVFGGSAQ